MHGRVGKPLFQFVQRGQGMLNLLRSSKLELRKLYIEMMMAFGTAVLVVAALIVWEEINAQQEMAQAISNLPSFVSIQPMEVVSESEAANEQLEITRELLNASTGRARRLERGAGYFVGKPRRPQGANG
jgi:hypothetical protein